MNPLEKQEGGSHYKDLPIQPVEFCQRNRLGFCESSVVKYVTRHRSKNGAQDIRKAIHFLELLLELEYQEDKKPVENTIRLCSCTTKTPDPYYHSRECHYRLDLESNQLRK